MKKNLFALVCFSLLLFLSSCQSQPEYCTVKGTVKGIKDGMKLELEDAFDHFNVIGTTRVKDGSFEFHPRVSAPTHVYLYSKDGKQLKDFFLEPGTIVADVDATDEDDMSICATGTPANDFERDIDLLYLNGEDDAALRRWNEIINAGENGILALYYAGSVSNSAVESLNILDHLAPEIASKAYISELREELTRRTKTEPALAGAEVQNYYIDMEFPDMGGNPVSLSSVVNNPANRLVLLDFWATWCDPCRDAIPSLKALYAEYHGKGLEIYSVSEDPKSMEADWKSFLAENVMNWINVKDTKPGRNDNGVWFEYALDGIPTTILLDGETGAILHRGNLQDARAMIASMLE